MDVDAMEFSGKWYTVKILEIVLVETVAADEDDEGVESKVCDTPRHIKKERVQVNFREHSGYMDWIVEDSDRLQTSSDLPVKQTYSPQRHRPMETIQVRGRCQAIQLDFGHG
jgi:hypothetical protein